MPYDLSKLSVSIIDGSLFSRQILRSLFNAIDVPTSSIKEFDDAESALEDLKHFTPDLILCELTLPNMDGIAFVEAVRHLEEDEVKRYIPIIVCTAHSEQAKVIACRDAGAHEVLHKPLSVRTLYQRIVSVIENPRSFIYAQVFTGPDRRRRVVSNEEHTRRAGDAET
jgi:CheY-like chemotaxis protein